MLNPGAVIRYNTHRNGLDEVEATTYSWEALDSYRGNPEIAVVNFHFLPGEEQYGPGDVVFLDALRLRIIDIDLSWGDYIVMRDGWRAQLWQRSAPLIHWSRTIKSRLIATASVWGLARYRAHTIPEWSDIYAVAAVKRWMGSDKEVVAEEGK